MTTQIYDAIKDGSIKLSPNFLVYEFKCSDGSRAVIINPNLIILLQKIRDKFGKVIISSGYRTFSFNSTLKGSATNSQHCYGNAADIQIPGVTPIEILAFYETINKTGGAGLYTTFAHVDVRANRSRWDSRSGVQKVVNSFTGGVVK